MHRGVGDTGVVGVLHLGSGNRALGPWGDDTSTYKTGVGVFTPGSPADTAVDLDAVTGLRSLDCTAIRSSA